MDLFLLRMRLAEPAAQSGPGWIATSAHAEGRKDREIAKMKVCELEFDLILSSPYVRAKQTADIVAEVSNAKNAELSPNLAPAEPAKTY